MPSKKMNTTKLETPEVIYTGRGGLRIGSSFLSAWNYTFPFAKITIDKSRITIRYPFNKAVELPLADLTSVSVKKRLIYDGVVFAHNRPEVSPYVLYWTFDSRKVCAALESLGCVIESGSASHARPAPTK